MPETPNSEGTVIAVKHVSKYFAPSKGQRSIKQAVTSAFKKVDPHIAGGYWALKDVSFEIKKGEFFGIVGRNGSGKSTLLKMIAGIYAPTKGEIQVDGKIVPFIELGVGFNMELTGRDNVFLNGALLGFSRKEMAGMYDAIVAFAELGEHMDVKLKNFSSGMQVRLAFSIAIRAKSDILLIDEVLAVGDAAFQQKCFDYFEDLKRNNKTVVFVTHDMGSVRRFCQKAIYIKDGKLVQSGTALEIADLYAFENIETAQVEAGKDDKLTDTIATKVLKETANSVEFEVTYDSTLPDELYVGVTLMKDGVSIGEITTSLEKSLIGKGSLRFSLDTSILNGGTYQLDASLFKKANRGLVVFTRNKAKFVKKGSDITKGGALKLTDTWKYE